MNTPFNPEELYSELKHNIFVYGTLKREYRNHPVMHGATYAEFLGVKTTADDGWGLWASAADCIPFVYRKPEGGSKIQGEHWLVDDYGMDNVRWLEGGYDEEKVELECGIMAYIYTYPVKHLPIGKQGIDFPPHQGSISWPLRS